MNEQHKAAIEAALRNLGVAGTEHSFRSCQVADGPDIPAYRLAWRSGAWILFKFQPGQPDHPLHQKMSEHLECTISLPDPSGEKKRLGGVMVFGADGGMPGGMPASALAECLKPLRDACGVVE